ncbi:MAG: lytic murein transglycosylase B [Lysobacterales bacterium]|nr:MAG: lytic murein transglycosylase B [Xanthomonadales bacterium]
MIRLLSVAAAGLLLGACATATPPVVEARPRPVAAAEPATGQPFASRSEVDAFIREMTARHGIDAGALRRAFAQSASRPEIIELMDRPAEAKPWSAYRKIFLTEKRIGGGVEFMRANAAALARAEARYGVPGQVITAIIGVETLYGANTGKFPVFEALATLAFDYPRRADYFRKELENFLVLATEEGLDFRQPLGSYAGAMGLAQFMPSSYRRLAIDFDGDGHRNLWTDPEDAIGSIANYLANSGWRRADPLIALPARLSGPGWEGAVSSNFRAPKSLTRLSLAQWRARGVEPAAAVDAARTALLVTLDGETGLEPYLCFDNFYAITRYNLSALYAMAVTQLSEAIAARR